MRYLPIMLDLADRRCVVVGGGAVAARKLELLTAAGASITLIAPRVDRAIEQLAKEYPKLEIEKRPYRCDDLAPATLAFAATGDPELQAQIAADARRLGVWLNAVDEPEHSTFVMPAILERGVVTVAVGTAGASPVLAARTRDAIARQIGPEYEAAAALLQELRRQLPPGRPRQAAFVRLLDDGLLDALRADDQDRIAELTAAAVEACTSRVANDRESPG
jgi:siroheme synthase-like protein